MVQYLEYVVPVTPPRLLRIIAPANLPRALGDANNAQTDPAPADCPKMVILLVTSRSQEEQEEYSLAITGHLSLRS
jgi:hypothetical protein